MDPKLNLDIFILLDNEIFGSMQRRDGYIAILISGIEINTFEIGDFAVLKLSKRKETVWSNYTRKDYFS